MFEALVNFYNATSIIDLIFLIITILSLIKCYKKGFVLSILSMAKWLLAYVITLLIFPRIKPTLNQSLFSGFNKFELRIPKKKKIIEIISDHNLKFSSFVSG